MTFQSEIEFASPLLVPNKIPETITLIRFQNVINLTFQKSAVTQILANQNRDFRKLACDKSQHSDNVSKKISPLILL